MDTERLEQLRMDVLEGAKTIFKIGLVENNEGNVSVRNGKKEELFITPSANQYDTLTKEQIVHMSFDGTALSKGKLPSTEVKMHVAIYKSRPKVKCVIHTHSTFASMFSAVRKSIPVIMEEQIVFLGGSIDISSFGEAHTEDIGQAAIDALGIKNAALLANHGVITCGKSVRNAVKAAELVEKLAKIYWGSLLIGKPNIIPKEHFEKFEKIFNSLFACYPKKKK